MIDLAEALDKKTEEARIVRMCLDIAVSVLAHYQRSKTWAHIAIDIYETALRQLADDPFLIANATAAFAQEALNAAQLSRMGEESSYSGEADTLEEIRRHLQKAEI